MSSQRTKRTIFFARQARRELASAARWYEKKEAGLQHAFLQEVNAALERMAATPAASPLWLDNRRYRKGGVKRFPFILFFDDDGHRIRIIAVAHEHRKPGYWLARERS